MPEVLEQLAEVDKREAATTPPLTDAEKLALALEALELAEDIMSICGGDAYEGECAEPLQDKY